MNNKDLGLFDSVEPLTAYHLHIESIALYMYTSETSRVT
jgi:hypothetical protein